MIKVSAAKEALSPQRKKVPAVKRSSWETPLNSDERSGKDEKSPNENSFMGKTGSGKSTLSLLLTRLYDYTSGSIKIDGVELKDIQKAYLRRNVVPVLQDPFLFSKSISENILMANKKATKEEVQRAARIAAIDDTITKFKDGYDTAVGEKGMITGRKSSSKTSKISVTLPKVLRRLPRISF